MILYELVTGQMPFRALNIKEMNVRIVNIDYWMPDGFSDNLKDLIQKILVG